MSNWYGMKVRPIDQPDADDYGWVVVDDWGTKVVVKDKYAEWEDDVFLSFKKSELELEEKANE